MQLTVGELAHGGAAVARIDGRVVFVEGAIPGETVEAEVTHRRKDFWRAQATVVLEPAATRVEPPCPYFKAGCGGCQLQYLAYREQLAQKRQVLHRQLERAHLEFPMDRIDVLGMDDPWRYRLRGEFHVLRRGGTVSLGFYRKHTYQTLSIDDGLRAFANERRHNVAILRAIDADSWTRSGVQDGVGQVSLCDMPTFMSQHDSAHRQEIDDWRAHRKAARGA